MDLTWMNTLRPETLARLVVDLDADGHWPGMSDAALFVLNTRVGVVRATELLNEVAS